MRTLVSIALAAMVYPTFVFISLNPDVFTWPWEGRLALVVASLFVGTMTYTCPAWVLRS